MKSKSIRVALVLSGLTLAVLGSAPGARADEVTDWNKNMLQAGLAAKTSPLVMTRIAAIVQASVFDAINGIERRYTPVHVTSKAPRGASRRAAVIQAAYASLVKIYPAHQATLDAQLAASLAQLLENGDDEDPGESIERALPGVRKWPMRSGLGAARTVLPRRHRRSRAALPRANGGRLLQLCCRVPDHSSPT